MLEVRNLSAGYGGGLAIRDISLELPAGQVRALLGANGSGKSTLLRAIGGSIRVASGDILFEGKSIKGKAPHELAAVGIAHCLEGRRIFPFMSVMENLEIGAYGLKKLPTDMLDRVFELFPVLGVRRKQKGNTLSGGERQMLAVGQVLMSKPKALLLDEPSSGLSPVAVAHLGNAIRKISKEGIAVLWAEQNARAALKWSDYVYVLSTGKIDICGDCDQMRNSDLVRKAYLGL